MGSPQTIPSIRPISDLRTRLNEVEHEAKELQEPIIMTKNGTASLVVMDSQAFENLLQHERAVRKLREAEIEARYQPQTHSHDEVMGRARAIIETAQEIYEDN